MTAARRHHPGTIPGTPHDMTHDMTHDAHQET